MTAHNIKIPRQSIPRHPFISGFMPFGFVCNTRATTTHTHGLNDRKTEGFLETLLSVDESALRHLPEERILHFLISLNGF